MVWFIIGTRPEATKGWLFAKELAKFDGVRLRILFSGQHTKLLEDCLRDLGPIDGGDVAAAPIAESFGDEWREMFRKGLGRLLKAEKPDLLCLLGDTDTVRISAETGTSVGVPIAHLEAGIRHRGQYDRPEPEEVNRRIVTGLATFHFAPTAVAVANLRSEGVPSRAVRLAGDFSYCAIATAFDGLVRRIATGAHGDVDRTSGPYVLCTFHRATSLWEQDHLAKHFVETASRFGDLTFTIVSRPDTRWTDFYRRVGTLANVEIVPALQPSDFLARILQCEFILTDSAGVQQEGLILGKRVIGCRRETELYADHPRLLLVPPPFSGLSEAVGNVWPAEAYAYRGDSEPTLSAVRLEGLRVAKEIAWHIHNTIL